MIQEVNDRNRTSVCRYPMELICCSTRTARAHLDAIPYVSCYGRHRQCIGCFRARSRSAGCSHLLHHLKNHYYYYCCYYWCCCGLVFSVDLIDAFDHDIAAEYCWCISNRASSNRIHRISCPIRPDDRLQMRAFYPVTIFAGSIHSIRTNRYRPSHGFFHDAYYCSWTNHPDWLSRLSMWWSNCSECPALSTVDEAAGFVFVLDVYLGTIVNTIREQSALRLPRWLLPNRWFSIYPRTLSVRSLALRSYEPRRAYAWHLATRPQSDSQLNPSPRPQPACTDSKWHCNVSHVDTTIATDRCQFWFDRNWRCWPVLCEETNDFFFRVRLNEQARIRLTEKPGTWFIRIKFHWTIVNFRNGLDFNVIAVHMIVSLPWNITVNVFGHKLGKVLAIFVL